MVISNVKSYETHFANSLERGLGLGRLMSVGGFRAGGGYVAVQFGFFDRHALDVGQ